METTIVALFVEYDWQLGDALGNLLRLSDVLRYFEIECSPPLTEGNLEQKRVLRKTNPGDIPAIILREIAEGEAETLEFKSSLIYHRKKAAFSPGLPRQEYYSTEVLFSTLKTIAAFCNTKGGTVLLGVEDNGHVIGIEDDLLIMEKADVDGWELHLRQAIESNFTSGQTVNSYVSVQKARGDKGTVCRIQVAPRSQLTFLRKDARVDLYIRSGNRSIPVSFDQVEGYFDIRKLYV